MACNTLPYKIAALRDAHPVAIVAGVDAPFDMGRAGLNVFGNTAAVLVVRRFGGHTEADISKESDPASLNNADISALNA